MMKRWYGIMANQPWLFLIVWPIALSLFIAYGLFNRGGESFIETEVEYLWIPTGTEFYRDKEYLNSFMGPATGVSTFSGVAFVRNDDDNIMTSEHLNEIINRMKQIEVETKVEYNGHTFTWPDICFQNDAAALGTTYQFPCIRLSPMDFFQEAQWYFDDPNDDDDELYRTTWHHHFIQKRLVRPLVSRYGIMNKKCSTLTSNNDNNDNNGECNRLIQLRTNATYAIDEGYDGNYSNALLLLPDIQSMGMNHLCRICIEQSLENDIQKFQTQTQQFFELLHVELSKLNSEEQTNAAAVTALRQQIKTILNDHYLDRASIEEWYHYYTLRTIYSEIGAEGYITNYRKIQKQLSLLASFFPDASFTGDVTLEEAKQILRDHADHIYSSVSTAGAPFPFWGDSNNNISDTYTTPYLFQGTSPFGGSGIDMSGRPFSGLEYIQQTLQQQQQQQQNGNSTRFTIFASSELNEKIKTDPIYRWFLAAVTPMKADCGNGNLTGSNTGIAFVDNGLGSNLAESSLRWCTKHNTNKDGTDKTQQYYAKMFYDLLVDNNLLSITRGQNDPYDWTIGAGCGYDLQGTRFSFTNATSEQDIMNQLTEVLYNIDEGAVTGPIDFNILVGGIKKSTGSINSDGNSLDGSSNNNNSIQSVKLIQNIYAALTQWGIMERVKNCNRPGGPISNLTYDDATEILREFKVKFDEDWSEGWDDDDDGSALKFVSFVDDLGVIGSTGRVLEESTLDSNRLTLISILGILITSAAFLFRPDGIKSQLMICTIGVLLVILSFISALGFAVLVFNIKINISIAWTLPFIILGLGVDDMYIILLALREERDKAINTTTGTNNNNTANNGEQAAQTLNPNEEQQSKQQQLESSKLLFVNTMTQRVIVPVTMTSLVNASMFAVMNMVDIPIIYKTAQAALIAVIFLYLTVAVLAFPAYCYVDQALRQDRRRLDVFCCLKSSSEEPTQQQQQNNDTTTSTDGDGSFIYHRIYKVLLLNEGTKPFRAIILLMTLALTGIGVYGITQRETGFNFEDFFPTFNPAHSWMKQSTESVGVFGASIIWGGENYTDPDTQLFLTKQFEQLIETPHMVDVDTKQLWLASFSLWMSRLCTSNVDRSDPNVLACGRDQIYTVDDVTNANDACSSTWARNKYNAREKRFGNTCAATATANDDTLIERGKEGGVCRPTDQMHPDDLIDLGIDPKNMSDEDTNESWCPIFEGFNDKKLQFCLMKWHNSTGGGGGLVKEDGADGMTKDTRTPFSGCTGEFYNDAVIPTPLVLSQSPNLFAFNLNSQQDYLDLIKETRAVCDDIDRVRCVTTGLAHNFYEQFLYIEASLLKASCAAIFIGWLVSFLFLFIKLKREKQHPTTKVFWGSVFGAALIALTTLLSLIVVMGCSVLWDVSITAFSTMSFLLSIGFVVEYSVHVIHRFMEAPNHPDDNAMERVKYAMSFLTLPTFMAFVSSAIGVVCLAFTSFEFNDRYFFRPLITMVVVTYFLGCWFLPVFLTLLDSVDALKCGPIIVTTEEKEGTLGGESNIITNREKIEAIATNAAGDVSFSC